LTEMAFSLNHIIPEIQRKENAISLTAPNIIDEAYQMTIYLKEYLWSIREDITTQGFKSQWEEINFIRNIKPYNIPSTEMPRVQLYLSFTKRTASRACHTYTGV